MRRSPALTAALAAMLAGAAAQAAAAAWQDAEPMPLSDLRIDIPEDELAGERATPAASPAPAPARASTAAPARTPTPASAGAAAGPVTPPTLQERTQLAAAAERGRLLFELARAGQLTTRDMLARISDPAAAGVEGWVAAPEGNGLTVVYYAETAGGPEVVYRAQLVGGRLAAPEVFLAGSRPPLTPTMRRMAAARGAVAGLDRRPCPAEAAFNVIVVPPASAAAPVEVYKLSPQRQAGRYPLGGHYLASVAPDGTTVNVREFTRSCIDLDSPAPAAGARPAPLGVTHQLDPLPTEIHVFLSLWMNRPLLVATGEPDRVWAVAQGRIGLVGDPQAQAAVHGGGGR